MPRLQSVKSTHTFGSPGKNCTGPVENDPEQDPEGVDELGHTDPVGATASPSLDVLQSLAESVKLLSTEVKSLRQETNDLRTLVRPPVSQQQQAQAAPLLLHCPSFVP